MQYSVVNFAKVVTLPTFRFDSEYYLPMYLQIENILKEKQEKFVTFKKSNLKIDASAFYPSLEPYYGLGIMPFIRVLDTNMRIDYDNCIKIPLNVFNEYKTLKMGKKGDIIITKGGSVARIGLLEKDSALCRDLIFVNTSKLPEKDYVFIFYYFLTDFYNKLLIRSSSMTAQPHLTLTLVKDIPIYTPNEPFRDLIYELHCQNTRYYQNSKQLYYESQMLLLSELGLLNWKPEHHLSFIKNYSDSQQAERSDAEYFQPKYDEIVEAVKGYSGGWDKLKNHFNQNKMGFDSKKDKEYNYLEIGGVNISSGEVEALHLLGSELPANAKIRLLKNNLVVSKVRTYRGAVAIIDRDDLIGSGAFTVLQESGAIKKETLFVLLKSLPYLELSLKFNTGTSYPTIIDDDILNYPIPLIDENIQEEIQQKIIESSNLRKQSKHLLECAKRAVEIAIEENEEEAEKWLNEEMGVIN